MAVECKGSVGCGLAMQPNPFSTRFIQPGAIPYQFFNGENANKLAQQFLSMKSKRGIIVGPHGSGKSTLVATILQEIATLSPKLSTHSVRFSTNQSPARALRSSLAQWQPNSVVVLDGYEQLSLWSRWQADRRARSQSVSILATAHQPVRGFDLLWQTSVDENSSRWVVEKLLVQAGAVASVETLVDSAAWQRSREQHGQNLRESLFDMYDWWQSIEAR